jgi:hypothetical protein
MPDIAVHEIAGEERKGTYFGFADTRYSAFFFGPVAGGILLTGSVPTYFVVMSLFTFLCVPLLVRKFAAPADAADAAVPAPAPVSMQQAASHE